MSQSSRFPTAQAKTRSGPTPSTASRKFSRTPWDRLFVESQENRLGDLHPTYVTNTREYPMSFYALRVKTVLGDEYDHPYGFAEMGVDKGWWKRDSKEYEYMPDRLKCT